MEMRRTRLAAAILHMAFLGFTAGCLNHNVQMVVPKQNEETPISFLKDGQTTKSEVTSRLGEIQAKGSEDDRTVIFTLDKNDRRRVTSKLGERQTWESKKGRILIYILDKKYRVASSVDKTRFHLILVFDENDGRILKKHSLVRIR